MTDHDELERVIETLKEPVNIDSSFDRRVMSAIGAPASPEGSGPEAAPPSLHGAAEPLPSARKSVWLSPRWTIRLSPLGGLLAAAAVAGIILATSSLTRRNESTEPVAALPELHESANATQFVLVAPEADSVLLVGDFNDWGLTTTRLARQPGDGVWFVTVVLPPGRYRYAFIVNGTTWRSNPATQVTEDEFGRPNSVVTVGGVI